MKLSNLYCLYTTIKILLTEALSRNAKTLTIHKQTELSLFLFHHIGNLLCRYLFSEKMDSDHHFLFIKPHPTSWTYILPVNLFLHANCVFSFQSPYTKKWFCLLAAYVTDWFAWKYWYKNQFLWLINFPPERGYDHLAW